MSRLEDVHHEIFAKAEELAVEGISITNYWFARANIDREEYLAYQDRLIADIITDEDFLQLPEYLQLRVIVTHGFLHGLVYGRGKQDNEF
jgi:hypothetical protein